MVNHHFPHHIRRQLADMERQQGRKNVKRTVVYIGIGLGIAVLLGVFA